MSLALTTPAFMDSDPSFVTGLKLTMRVNFNDEDKVVDEDEWKTKVDAWADSLQEEDLFTNWLQVRPMIDIPALVGGHIHTFEKYYLVEWFTDHGGEGKRHLLGYRESDTLDNYILLSDIHSILNGGDNEKENLVCRLRGRGLKLDDDQIEVVMNRLSAIVEMAISRGVEMTPISNSIGQWIDFFTLQIENFALNEYENPQLEEGLKIRFNELHKSLKNVSNRYSDAYKVSLSIETLQQLLSPQAQTTTLTLKYFPETNSNSGIQTQKDEIIKIEDFKFKEIIKESSSIESYHRVAYWLLNTAEYFKSGGMISHQSSNSADRRRIEEVKIALEQLAK